MPQDPPRICGIEPFVHPATPQIGGEEGASASELNLRALEDFLERQRQALCADIQAIIDECCSEVEE